MSSALSSIAPHSSSHTITDTITTPSIGKAATSPPLVRVMLESYGVTAWTSCGSGMCVFCVNMYERDLGRFAKIKDWPRSLRRAARL
jgi:hypothetical protein